jgi:hypothetical protein
MLMICILSPLTPVAFAMDPLNTPRSSTACFADIPANSRVAVRVILVGALVGALVGSRVGGDSATAAATLEKNTRQRQPSILDKYLIPALIP